MFVNVLGGYLFAFCLKSILMWQKGKHSFECFMLVNFLFFFCLENTNQKAEEENLKKQSSMFWKVFNVLNCLLIVLRKIIFFRKFWK